MASDPQGSQSLLQVCRNLSSLALLGQELTPEECILIADYVVNMADAEKLLGKHFPASG